MIALGAYVALTGVCTLDSVKKWMEHQFSGKAAVIELNRKALDRGFELGKAQEVKA
ncbi:MAG: 2-oxoacid:acceptor oxidoreductase family protein [bacterium]|nr:2-oxoacid:acceptor oxidoreductase family protein [bacterium]